VVSVNMGYGHQRTAYPLKYLAFENKIINANDYRGIPERDKNIWESTRKLYEFISNFERIPLLGNFIFSIYDIFQRILSFYPKRELSEPNFSLKQIYSLFKGGWGADLIEKLKKDQLPLVTTFFPPAFMAEFFHYPREIFCVVCDADISRSWASFNPKLSRIKYFVPNERVIERLKLYGVKEENIFLTGYPLPLENISSNPPAGGMEILKEDLRHRILNLDPQKRYFEKYKTLIKTVLGELPQKSDHPLTLMFSVGGAGAQKEIGIKILKSLKKNILDGEIKLILSAGIREKVKNYFEKEIGRELPFADLKGHVEILYREKIEDYFKEFNQKLRKTDVLWTKPSELSFYSALGLPIIIAPPVGSQEKFNRRWLLKSGFGESQGDPNNTDQWLFDWLDQGYLAERAVEGFIEGEKLGTLNIQKIVEKCSG
ncbi:MAG TPA: hypothetical protein VGB37_01605, partial [Candidatus Lokiarchaeia archaeon]